MSASVALTTIKSAEFAHEPVGYNRILLFSFLIVLYSYFQVEVNVDFH